MNQVTHEDLNFDRRVTRTEEGIIHNKANIEFVDRNTKFSQALIVAGLFSLGALLVGQFYFIYKFNEEHRRQFIEINRQFGEVTRQFDEVTRQFGEVKHQIVEVRAEVADNRRLIEENSVRLDSLTAQVGTLTSEAKETNERLDNIDGRLAVVEDVLTINHQAPAHYQVGKL